MLRNKIQFLALSCFLATSASQVQAGTLLGSYIEHDGWSVSDIQKFNNDASKPLGAVNLFTNFDFNWDFLTIQSSNIVNEGSTPIITLMPYSSQTPDMLSSIINGEQDAYIQSWIAGYQAWQSQYAADNKPRIFLRFGHEFNGNWYGWGNQPEKFKQAWRHIHALFDNAGINQKIDWVWAMNNFNVDSFNDVTRYYPGDDVVDWTAIDGYNWGSNFSFSSWASFDEVFSSAYTTLVTNYPDKPIMISEVGSAEPSDVPDPSWGQNGNDADYAESKEAWVDHMFERIETTYPAIFGVAWFNTNKELSWSLNGTAKSGYANTGLTAYNQRISSGHYVSSYEELVSSISPDEEPIALSFTDVKETFGKNVKETQGSLFAAFDRSNMPDMLGQPLSQYMGTSLKHLSLEVADQILERIQTYNPAIYVTAWLNTTKELGLSLIGTKKEEARDKAESNDKEKQSGLMMAIERSNMPDVVGQRHLQRMSEGFKNLPPEALEKIRNSRLHINQ